MLVVYFSHAGENYNVGVIEEGNTAKMGKIIAEQMSADIFELVPVIPYSNVYDEVLDQATKEQRTSARPEYEGEIENWEQYDTVFIYSSLLSEPGRQSIYQSYEHSRSYSGN